MLRPYPVGESQLLAHFEGGRLLALGGERVVPGVAAVPTQGGGRLDGQVEGLVVCSVDEQDRCPENQQLGNLRRRRRPRRQDYGRLSGGRRHPRPRPRGGGAGARGAPAAGWEGRRPPGGPQWCTDVTRRADRQEG